MKKETQTYFTLLLDIQSACLLWLYVIDVHTVGVKIKYTHLIVRDNFPLAVYVSLKPLGVCRLLYKWSEC